MAVTKDLGAVTAYAHAKAGGYTGTKVQFEQLMASYATVAQQAAASATAAAGSASAAADSAEEAQGYAESLDPDTIARVDGYYDTLAAGSAEQLISSIFEEDSEPYNFRTSGGSIDIGDRETDMLVGGTVAWNQLANLQNGQDMASQYLPMFNLSGSVGVVSGHKYLVSFVQPAGCAVYRQTGTRTGFPVTYKNYTAPSVNTRQDFLVGATDTASYDMGSLISKLETTEESYHLSNQMLFDLTQMFGSTIADYIYSLEQANAGAGVAWFRKLFPKSYYAYNAGELMSVNAVSHDTVGFNQADMSAIEIGKAWNAGSNSARASLFIPVLPNTTYCLNVDGTSGFDNVFWGEVNAKGDLTNNRLYAPSSYPYVFTTMANTHVGIIQFNKTGVSASDFANVQVNLNLSWDGERDGEYEEYVKHSYPLDDSLTLRGIPKLDANNNLYYDGDEYESDGTVTRKYGIVDLSSKTWTYQSSWGSWYTDYISDMRGTDTGAETPKFICDKYDTIATNYGLTPQDFNGITSTTKGGSGCRILVRNGSTTTPPTGTLVYELATPTTETADPYTNPQIVDDFGTEEYVDGLYSAGTRDVAIPVGHYTQYMPNLKAKLEMAPNSPDGDGDYIVHQSNGENEYMSLGSSTVITGLIARIEALEAAAGGGE